MRKSPVVRLCESLETGDSVFNARMYTQWAAYRALPNPPSLYRTEKGAQLLLCDGVLTLDGTGFDPEELRRFAALCGCHTVTCSGEAAARLAPLGRVATEARIMRYAGGETVPCAEVSTTPRLDDVFPLLCGTFENMRDAVFERWYSDVSLKLRRGLAYVYAIYEENIMDTDVKIYESPTLLSITQREACPKEPHSQLTATAGVYYQNAATAVIGSVAAAPERRGRGLAGMLLQTLISRAQSEGRTPQVICLNDRAYRLYSRLGFVETGIFYEIKL